MPRDSVSDVELSAPQVSDPPSIVEGTEGDLADALHAIGHFTSLIHNADAKAGLGAAAIAGLLAITSQQTAAIAAVLDPDKGNKQLALIVLSGLALSLIVTAAAVGYSLIPRTPLGTKGGRFSYPTVANSNWRFHPIGRTQAATEAWEQAKTLAQIARRKFFGVKVALVALGVALFLCGAWTVLAAEIGDPTGWPVSNEDATA